MEIRCPFWLARRLAKLVCALRHPCGVVVSCRSEGHRVDAVGRFGLRGKLWVSLRTPETE